MVVGGGLTAGHLVLGALKRSARVTLVARRPIVERNFDVERVVGPSLRKVLIVNGILNVVSIWCCRHGVVGACLDGCVKDWNRVDAHLAHVVGSIESGSHSDTGPLGSAFQVSYWKPTVVGS